MATRTMILTVVALLLLVVVVLVATMSFLILMPRHRGPKTHLKSLAALSSVS